MGWTTDLLEGVAEHLATNNAGVWRPTGPPYEADETGIVMSAMPPAPDRIICLASYPVSDMVQHGNVVVGIQVRVRAGPDPRDVQDLDDLVYDLLHDLRQVTFGDAYVAQMYRRSSAALGQARDGRDLWERVANFYADAVHATTHRLY